MILLRSALFNVLFYLVLVVMLVVGIPLMLAPEQTVKNYARLWSRISLRMLAAVCHVHLEYRGLEHVPTGGFILAAKHQSFLDILALLPVAPHFVYIMKRELAWIPLFGHLMRRGGMIPIDRSKGRAIMGDLTVRVQKVVASGQQLIIFPEGTRRAPGDEPSYKSGVSHLYAGTGVACVPAAMNAGMFWPRRGFMRYPGTLVVEFLPLIPPGLTKSKFQATLQNSIEVATNRLLDEIRRERFGKDPASSTGQDA